MDIQELRQDLHQFIDRADEHTLNILHGIITAHPANTDRALMAVHDRLLDERLKEGDVDKDAATIWESKTKL